MKKNCTSCDNQTAVTVQILSDQKKPKTLQENKPEGFQQSTNGEKRLESLGVHLYVIQYFGQL